MFICSSPLCFLLGDMCQFCVVQHSYQKCQLVKTGDASVSAKPYKLLPNILRRTPSEIDPPVTNQKGPHLIRETRIIQCSTAQRDPDQQHKPLAERRCRELVPMIEGDRETVTEHPEKPCSACQAGDEATAAALTRDLIVSNIRGSGLALLTKDRWFPPKAHHKIKEEKKLVFNTFM
jgi:hypothetical protein